MQYSLVTRTTLRKLAGAAAFKRGVAYFEEGLVASLMATDERISGKVRGTREYQTKLWEEDKAIGYNCTCPIGRDGDFCKHCVALGLAWLAGETPKGTKSAKTSKRRDPTSAIRNYLRAQEPDALIDLILQWAQRDDSFQQDLLLKATSVGDTSNVLKTFKDAINKAANARGFVDYYAMPSYAQGLGDVVDSLAELLKKGQATAVIDLCEYAVKRVADAIESVDDSDGYMGEILQRLQDIHLAACIAAKPDPEELAQRMFKFELSSEWDTFHGAAKTYAKVLGKKGLALYRALAEVEWRKVPPLTPGMKDTNSPFNRFRITHIMETLAEQSGDVESLIAIKTRDLSHAYYFLKIAEIYSKARQHDKALEWAERGIVAFPQRTDNRLRDFLAEEYLRRKRIDDALNLIWVQFAESLTVENYKKLHRFANPIKRWTDFRDQALDTLRKSIQSEYQREKSARWNPAKGPDNSSLVEIFLWEKDAEAAWREAKAGMCRRDLLLKLAAIREQDCPLDSIDVYKNLIDPIVNGKNNEAYKEAAGLLRKIRLLMQRLGQEQVFQSYLANVRVAHKPKRNFMALLEPLSKK